MAKTNWLRRALLGSAAIGVMSGGAQADELSALKAQLEALQAQVNTMEAQQAAPAPAPLPANKGLLTYERGMGGSAGLNRSKTDSVNNNDSRGFTIGVTPTADLPAPVAEVTVYGFVKGDVIYSTDDDPYSRSFTSLVDVPSAGTGDRVYLQANQSRFGVRSRIDTAVGQIRTRLEGDFEGSPYGSTSNLRLRHAYGQWDMTPNWTVTVGQYWHLAALLPVGITTVDFGGAGWGNTYGRTGQVRLEYFNGPLTVGFGISQPSQSGNTNLPNFGGYIQYDMAGGHQFIVSGEIADWDVAGLSTQTATLTSTNTIATGFAANMVRNAADTASTTIVTVTMTQMVTITTPVSAAVNNSDLAWVVQGGANINLGDIATLTGFGVYGAGLVSRYCRSLAIPGYDAAGNAFEGLCAGVGVSFSVNETTTLNAAWSYAESVDNANASIPGETGTYIDDMHMASVNLMWQPVRQMRWGWEVMYADVDSTNGSGDTFRGQFGAWFFF